MYLIIGSNGGAPRDPAWVRTLRARPDAVIWARRRRIRVKAELLSGFERERAFASLAGLWPAYERYHTRAAPHRELPEFLLRPVHDGERDHQASERPGIAPVMVSRATVVRSLGCIITLAPPR